MCCRLTELLAKYAGLMRTSGGYSRPGTSNPLLAAPAPPEDGAGAVSRPATSETALQVGAPVHQHAGTTTWLFKSNVNPAPHRGTEVATLMTALPNLSTLAGSLYTVTCTKHCCEYHCRQPQLLRSSVRS